MEFKKVEDEVRPILEQSIAARCDDMALYANYVFTKLAGFERGAGWLERVFSDRRLRISYGIAPYNTVSRVRRKLQEEDEDLRAPQEYIDEKKQSEKEYKNYARGLKQWTLL